MNNAGWQLNKTLLETTAEEFNAVLNTNLTSMFLFTKGAANMFIAQKTGGAIVNVCSTFAVVDLPGYVAYHASKGGVASFTRAAAISLMPHNIRVNAVGPGTTETPDCTMAQGIPATRPKVWRAFWPCSRSSVSANRRKSPR